MWRTGFEARGQPELAYSSMPARLMRVGRGRMLCCERSDESWNLSVITNWFVTQMD